MTEKVQKIREEVEKLMYSYNLEADIASCEDAETEKLANIKYQLCKKILDYIDKVQEEPVSEDLEKAADKYESEQQEKYKDRDNHDFDNYRDGFVDGLTHTYEAFMSGAKWQQEQEYTCYEEAFEDGAKWKAEQFEKNRLAACDRQTDEEAEIERDFVTSIIEKEHRPPTFDDAIKYGMRLQKEKMMAKAFPVEIDSSRSDGRCILSGNFARFETGDKVKLVIINED